MFICLMTMHNVRTLAGEEIPWSFFSLPWHMFFGAVPIVCLVLHYCSLQEHRSLASLHTARARRSSGRTRSVTWGMVNACLDPRNFMNALCLDVTPLCFLVYTDPLHLVFGKTYVFIMSHWFKLVVSCFKEDQRARLAFLSDAAYDAYATLRFGDENNVPEFIRNKCISEDDNELTLGVQIYNGKFWNKTALKLAKKGSLYLTRVKKEFTGNEDEREVLYLCSMFDENSEAYKNHVTNRKKCGGHQAHANGDKWQNKYQQLVACKEKHDNCLVPQNDENLGR